MYAVELTFTGDDRRLAARPAHREILAAHYQAGRLVMAGPLADDSGALLIFDVEDIEEIIASDPYYTTPGVQVASIRPWTPLFPPPADSLGFPSTHVGGAAESAHPASSGLPSPC